MAERNRTVGRLVKQALFLFDDAVVVADGLRVRRMKRDDATIEEAASNFRTTAYHFHFISRKPDRVQLCKITSDGLALSVDECLL